jgi:hypothetical protein
MGKRWTEQENIYLKQNYELISYKEIAVNLQRTIESVSNQVRKLSLYNSKGCGNNKMSHKRQYEINESFFKVPNILNCYWAGFLAADGNVRKKDYRTYVCLQNGDKEHLNKLKQDIEYSGEIKNYSGAAVLSINSRKIYEDLMKNFNIVPKKSLILKPPKLNDIDLILSFFVGYLDGDGTIYETIYKEKYHYINSAIIGTEEMMIWFKEVLEKELNIVLPKIQKHKNVYKLCFNGKTFITIFNRIKDYQIPKLERKWSLINGTQDF